tara:strand:- start:13511 stop:13909 length:399 start_codon:yes stop_codon:yes gene_type:complete
MLTNNKKFNLIKEMKSYLQNKDKNNFTRKEFRLQVGVTAHVFNQLLSQGLIIDTQKAYIDQPGTPHIFKLNDAFTSHMALNTKYKLTQEDVDILLNIKSNKLTTLSDSIKTMNNEISSLERQKNALMQYKVN